MIKKCVLLSLIFTTNTFAGQWMGDYEIKSIVVEGQDNTPYANINIVPNPQTTCRDNTFVTMPTAYEMGKQSLSVMMMAMAANKRVKLYIDGCLGERPHVKHVWVIK